MIERFDDPDHEQDHDSDNEGPGSENEDPVLQAPSGHAQHALTLDVMDRAGITIGRLWLHYLNMGGDIGEFEVDAYLHGLIRLPVMDRDVISQAVNEMIDDMARGARAPYSSSTNRKTSEPDLDRWDLPTNRKAIDRSGFSAGHASKEPLLSVVYSSAATRPLSDEGLTELLTSSRRTNHDSHLTGLLLYREGRFLQVLEGPEAAIRHRMAIISADPRHDHLRVLIEESREERQFPVWTMRYGTIGPAMAKYVSGYERTFADAEDDADPDGTVRVLRDLIRWFEDHAIPLR